MTTIEAIILGIIQGITEPLPISSSGHLEIIQELFGISSEDLTYEVFLNFGSLLAICFIYRKLLAKIFGNTFKYVKTKEQKYQSDFKYFYLVFFATIPAVIVGFLFEDFIEEFFTSGLTTGIMLIVTAVFIFLIKNFNGTKDIDDMNVKDALIIGGAQSVALIPGISRSGSTIVGSMFRNLRRDVAFDFSFLMYIPISLGIFVTKLKDLDVAQNGVKYLVGTLFAMVTTYFATKWFRNIVVNGKMIIFSYYCLVVGIFAIILFI